MSVCEIVGFLSAFFIVYIRIRVYINTIATLVPYTTYSGRYFTAADQSVCYSLFAVKKVE